MTEAPTITKGAAQAAPAPAQVSRPNQAARIAPNASDLVSALCFAIAETNPALADRTEAHLAHLLSMEDGRGDSRTSEISATLEWYRDIVACAAMLKGKAPPLTKPSPEPSGDTPSTRETVLWLAQSKAIIKALGRKKGERFLQAMVEEVRDIESAQHILPLGPANAVQALKAAQLSAVQLFRNSLGQLIGSLARERA